MVAPAAIALAVETESERVGRTVRIRRKGRKRERRADRDVRQREGQAREGGVARVPLFVTVTVKFVESESSGGRPR